MKKKELKKNEEVKEEAKEEVKREPNKELEVNDINNTRDVDKDCKEGLERVSKILIVLSIAVCALLIVAITHYIVTTIAS